MKRVGNLYNQMLTRHTMEEAFRGVMKDKKQKDNPNSLSFMMKNNKEYYIADAADFLIEELSNQESLEKHIDTIRVVVNFATSKHLYCIQIN